MSMQSVLGVVGGVVGSFFGYPQLGFMVGSLVGGLLTPKEKTEGPRLDDLKVQVSTYGAGIPILYGTERIGGNVIWSTDKLEFANTTEVGKGGGAENTSYTYFVQMRIALHETPRDGSITNIVKIFVDGKLQWDASSGIPVTAALASEENPFSFFTLYQGHADQLPDAIEEIYAGGPGTVPAYKGIVSIAMRGIQCPGGRVPQFSFVLSTNATVGTEITELLNTPDTRDTNQTIIGMIGSSSVVHSLVDVVGHAWPRQIQAAQAEAGAVVPIGLFTQEAGYDPNTVNPSNLIPIVGGDPAYLQLVFDSSLDFADDLVSAYRIDAMTGASALLGKFVHMDDTIYTFDWAAFDEQTGLTVLVPSFGSLATGYVLLDGLTGMFTPGPSHGFGPTAFYGGIVHMMKSDGTAVTSLTAATGVEIDTFSLPGMVATSGARIMTANSTGVYALVIGSGGGAVGGVFRRTATGYEVLTGDVFIGTSDTTLMQTFYCNGKIAIIGPNLEDETLSYNVLRFNAVDIDDVKVNDIIADLCDRSIETRYDVSAIPDTDTLRGYKIQNPASARANIEPLLTAFAIYIVDEDGLAKFKKYEDITSEATISYDELGQAEDGAEPADAMPLNRSQEIDLPRSVTVSYVEPTFDYQTASEKESRQVTEANEDLTIELPLATTSDHAKKVAQMILFARWRAQNTRSLKVSRKYAFLSPGDGVTVEYPRGAFRLWRIMNMTDTGALIELSVEPGDSEIYTQTAVGATDYVSQEVSAIPSQTNMLLLDAPIMRDVDNNAGLYVAAEGYGPSWRGYTLWVGDDDSNLQDRGTLTTPCPIGFAESALGAWLPNFKDGKNSVVISMGDDELNSTTDALLMTSRVNLALVGADGRWEAVQFQTASSLGGGRYLIYGLLRGLFGTERYRGTHESGDKFVLITPAGMLRPNQDVGSLGQIKSYRAVSLGRSKDSAPSQSFANTGVGLLPYSPWDARKSKGASNDQTITWQRRSRLSTNALRGIVPLGESAEAYRVDFYTSSAFTNLAGSLTSTSKTLTITSAQQTALGLTPGGTLYIHISQISDSVGAGAPLEATL